MLQLYALLSQGFTRAYLGDSDGARVSADAALAAAADLMEFFEGLGHATVAVACQAAGDHEAANQAYAFGRQWAGLNRMMAGLFSWSALAHWHVVTSVPLGNGPTKLWRYATAVICRRRC